MYTNISYIQIKEKSKCTGCSACASVCTHKAITLREDNEGFLFPSIDKTKCVNCGLCSKVCPVLNDSQKNSYGHQKSFLTISKYSEDYFKSATTGVCTILSRSVVEKGGKVYGVYLDESEWKAKHTCAIDELGIERIRNSKYLQSELGETFCQIKKNLEANEQVLFIGTPCQVAGLKACLRKDYAQLITIDIICHGVYSHKLLKEEVKYWENRLHGKIKNFRFRSKKKYPWTKGGIINFDVSRWYGNQHYEFFGPYSPTYRCYAYSGDGNNYNLRECCYSCPFRDKARYGDVTIGDAWYIDINKYFSDNGVFQKGVSLLIENTKRGSDIIKSIEHRFIREAIPVDEAFAQPALKPSERRIPQERYELYNNLGREDYGSLINRLLKIDIKELYRKDERMDFRNKFKNFIKKLFFINKYRSLKTRFHPGWEWWFINSFLYNFPSKRFRNYCLRKMGMSIDKDVRIYAGFHIRDPKGIIIEKGVSIGPKVLLDGRRGLTIKESAVIGYGAIIWTLNHDYNDIHFKVKGAPITIGKFAWVCSNSIILPGVTIGEGAVVASGAIVTHDVPPYTIVGGIPAKVIGQRDKKEYDYGYSVKSDILHFC